MKTSYIISIALLSMVIGFAATFPLTQTPIAISYPDSWPEPIYDFEKNPLSKEGVELGRKLFYDPILSSDNSISCSHCHLSYSAFTHIDHALSHGINDSIGNRNSLALMNLAWNTSFMWDGAVNHLDVQALAPISDAAEMNEDIVHVIEKLRGTSYYPSLFLEAFGDSTITGEHLLKALSQFQLTLITANSKYDQVMRNEDGISFTDQEQNGYELFKTHCNSCHQEPLFNSNSFMSNGLPVDSILMDFGRMKITQLPQDSLKFKVPTLRNIEFSYPYMHDGRFKKLSQVMKHYTSGIIHHENLASQLKNNIQLSNKDQVDLIAFLLTLSDKEFLFNKDFAFPR